MFEDDLDLYPLCDNKNSSYINFKRWLNLWLDDLVVQKVSNKTIKSYQEAIGNFLKFVRYNKIDMDKISARYINRYLLNYQIELARIKKSKYLNQLLSEQKLHKIGKNDANFTILKEFENSLSHRLTILKMFLKYITQNNAELHDYTMLFNKLVKIKISEKMTQYLLPEEINKIINFMNNWDEQYKRYFSKSSKRDAIRNAFLLTLYAVTGARGDEVVHIKLNDIENFSKDKKRYYIVNIEEGKGGKKRRVLIDAKYIDKYIEYYKKAFNDKNYYISSTWRRGNYTNKPMHINTLRNFSNTILKILGINKSGLHIYRRGYATKRIGIDKVDISIVAKELGNTSAILEKYYLKYTPELNL